MKGLFKRSFRPLEGDCFFSIHHNWIKTREERRKSYGKWYRISSEHGAIYRLLRMNPRLRVTSSECEGEIAIDYDAWLKLSGFASDTPREINLTIRRAYFIELFVAGLTHPDPTYRLSMGLGLISLCLGLVSYLPAIF